MATAVTRKPKTETKVIEICPGKVTLELSWREAELIKALTCSVGGGIYKDGRRGNTADRKLNDELYWLLDRQGVETVKFFDPNKSTLQMRDEGAEPSRC